MSPGEVLCVYFLFHFCTKTDKTFLWHAKCSVTTQIQKREKFKADSEMSVTKQNLYI